MYKNVPYQYMQKELLRMCIEMYLYQRQVKY